MEEVLLIEARDYDVTLDFNRSGEPFYCDDEKLKNILSSCIRDVMNINPAFSAAGGTSDGRFIPSFCNIIEFGLSDKFMHQKNERAKIEDLQNLEKIYLEFFKRYFT
jgi:succinyl-diaminopimelate desuccinylase